MFLYNHNVKRIITLLGYMLTFVIAIMFQPSKADDINLFALGGGTSDWPSTVVFAFDTSGSMTNLICRDFPSSYGGDCTNSSHWYAKQAPNGATVCANDVFQYLAGPDQDGDGIRDPYIAPFDSDGVTYTGYRYDILNEKGSGTNDDQHSPYVTYQHDSQHSWYSPTWPKVGSPDTSASNNEARMVTAIENTCERFQDCEKRNRCVYSLRTLGYFSERSSSCGSGDPYGMCNCVTTAPVTPPTPSPITMAVNYNNEAENMTYNSSDGTIQSYSSYSNGAAVEMNTSPVIWTYNSTNPSGNYDVTVRIRRRRHNTIDVKLLVNGSTIGTVTQTSNNNNWQWEDYVFNNVQINQSDQVRFIITKSHTNQVRFDVAIMSGTITMTEPVAAPGQRVQAESMVHSDFDITSVGLKTNNYNHGLATFLIQIPVAGLYKIQGYVNAPNSSDNTFWVNIGSDPGTSDYANGWLFPRNWNVDEVNSNFATPDPRTWLLAAGTHRVYIRGRERNCEIDWVEVINVGGVNYCSSAPSGTFSSGGSYSSISEYMRIYLGDWLNFYPPKYSSAVATFKKFVNALEKDVRIGITEFQSCNGSRLYPSSPRDVLPVCSDVGNDCRDNDTTTICLDSSSRTSLTNAVDNMVFNGGTPLARMLHHIAKIYSGKASHTPFCDNCMTEAYAILMTDGFPSGDDYGVNHFSVCKKLIPGFSDGTAFHNGEWVDDVAYCMANADLRDDLSPLAQSVNTYTITFGLMDPNDPDKCVSLLAQTATAGNGECYPAYDIQSLSEAFTTIISNIVEKAVTFTAPSVPTVRGGNDTNVTTAVFRPTMDYPLWEGHLYCFGMCDEELNYTGTTCECGDTNDDEEICVIDALGNQIEYDDKGNIKSMPYWDAQLCLSGDIDNVHAADTLTQDPFNLDVSNCYRYANESKPVGVRRNIITVIDDVGPASKLNASDTTIEFLTKNLVTYPEFYTAMNTGSDFDLAEMLVQFYRGLDVGDRDLDGNTSEERNLSTMITPGGDISIGWYKLGDTFHSSPALVEHRTNAYTYASYEQFGKDIIGRPAVFLVGANDGMLHAFHAGDYDAPSSINGVSVFLDGRGEELWAFIPPELLPKLKNMCDLSSTRCLISSHQYYVDGKVMFRDAWIGGLSDDKTNAANSKYWKTLLIGGLRQGGNSYYALDITDTEDPKFLYEFPPRTPSLRSSMDITEDFGETWLDTGPSPASIGPIVDNNTKELFWVAAVSAGYDRTDQIGRGFYLLNPYTGDVMYEAQYDSSDAILKNMKYSFPGTPALTDARYDRESGQMVFKRVVAIDHAGQVWSLRLNTGSYDSSSGKILGLGTPTLFFTTNKTRINPGAPINASNYQTRPVFFIPATKLERDKVTIRVVFGTGDRDKMVPEGEGLAVDDLVCNAPGYLYSVKLQACASGARPCNEDDLTKVDGTNIASESALGCYYELRPGEKVSNAPNIFAGMAIFTTFYPTTECGRGSTAPSATTCGTSTAAKGETRLYMFDAESCGPAWDLNMDGVIDENDMYMELDPQTHSEPQLTIGKKAALLIPKDNAAPDLIKLETEQKSTYDSFIYEVSREVHEKLH